MVTTRSADKRLKQNGEQDSLESGSSRIDILALRSRLDPNGSLTEPSDVEASPLTSISKKRKVLDDTPPTKRTRRSFNLSQDNDADEKSPTTNESESQTALSARDEVPDSQKSPKKVHTGEPFESQADNIALEEDKPPSSARSRTPKTRKVANNKQPTIPSVTASTPGSVSKGKHKRFGSEELSDGPDTLEAEIGDTNKATTEIPVSEDDDEAPEVATTRNIPDNTLPSTTRRSRARKAEPKPKTNTVTPQSIINDEKTTTIPVDGTEPSEPQETPILTIDTSQDPVLETANASQDSEDSAFMTARTSRHVDIFSTPLGGTPQLKSPDLQSDSTVMPSDGTPIRQQQLIPVSNHIDLNSQVSGTSKSVLPSRRVEATSQALPRKKGNSLEMFRRQLLHNRAEKAAKGARGGGQFRLQSEWAGKRKRFVVGY